MTATMTNTNLQPQGACCVVWEPSPELEVTLSTLDSRRCGAERAKTEPISESVFKKVRAAVLCTLGSTGGAVIPSTKDGLNVCKTCRAKLARFDPEVRCIECTSVDKLTRTHAVGVAAREGEEPHDRICERCRRSRVHMRTVPRS